MERRLRDCTLRVAAAQLVIAALNPFLAIAITETSKWLFATPWRVTAGNVFSGVRGYFGFADTFLAGQLPYRDYVVQYPLLAFPFLAAPRFFARSLLNYAILFTIEMLVVSWVATYLIARAAEAGMGAEQARERLRWHTLFTFGLGPVVFARYDLVPMTLALVVVLVWFSGRSVLGGTLAGAGILVKIFPVVIAGPAIVSDLARHRIRWWRGFVAMVAAVALGMVLWYGLAGAGMQQSVQYHLERGLEIESVYAGLLIVAAGIIDTENGIRFDHGSFQHVSPWSDSVARLSGWVQAAALLLVMWRFHRSGARDYIRFCGAALLAFIVTSKVLSPQFLIWIFPFMALLEGTLWTRARWVFLGSCVLTCAVYPWSFGALLALKPLGVAILNLRNLLLLYLLGLLLFSRDRGAVSRGARRGGGHEAAGQG